MSRRPWLFLLAYALAYAGGVIAYLPLLTLLLPVKVEGVAGAGRLDVLTAGVIAGALAASVSNVVFGMLSDRSLARGGSRRRWVAGGVAATAASYAGVGIAASPTTIVVAVAAFQLAVNALLAPLVAIMADEVPDAQKGVAGGLLVLGAPIASGVSALLVGAATLGEGARLAIVPLVVAGCVAPLVLGRSVIVTEPPTDAGRIVMARRDLLIAWTARLLIQVAGNVLSLYLVYYLESIVPDMERALLVARTGSLLTIAFLVPLPIAMVAGRWSDRTNRRKPFLLAAAGVTAIGLGGMAVAGNWIAAALAFGAYAIGSSTFLALHTAFAMQLLPDPRHRGRDLGLLNLTNTLPALAGPLLAWSLATPSDFSAVMAALAALALGGGLLILAVRGRR